MRNTPRKRRFDHALRGYWDRFPVSPKPYAKKSGRTSSPRASTQRMSFGIARTLDRYVEKAAKLLEAGKAAEAQASCGAG